MHGPHESIENKLDTYPCVWVILSKPPKRAGVAAELFSYGLPGQPFSGDLLSRGCGIGFASIDAAREHLSQSIARDKGAEYTKWTFRIIPVYLPYLQPNSLVRRPAMLTGLDGQPHNQ